VAEASPYFVCCSWQALVPVRQVSLLLILKKDHCSACFGAFSPGSVPSSQGIDAPAIKINDRPVIN
jgi:hypothetical protein